MNALHLKTWKKLLLLHVLSCMATFLSACHPKPADTTRRFLSNLNSNNLSSARALALANVQMQVDVIQQDKNALFNGQPWKYTILNEVVNGDSARVFYVCKLKDSSRVWQEAKLRQLKNGWVISDIANTRIVYSPQAIKTRPYFSYGNQMLIAPLDLEDIEQKKLKRHQNQFIIVSGNLCSFREKNNLLIMTMSEGDLTPLLTVLLRGKAKDQAKKDHASFMGIDSLVESPVGNTFTAIGLLKFSKGEAIMEISSPQNVIIGQYLRLDKP